MDDFLADLLRDDAAAGGKRRLLLSPRVLRAIDPRLWPASSFSCHVLDGGRVVSTELVLLSAGSDVFVPGRHAGRGLRPRPNDLLKHEAILWGRRSGKRAFVLGGGIRGRRRHLPLQEIVCSPREQSLFRGPANPRRGRPMPASWSAGAAGKWAGQLGMDAGFRFLSSISSPWRNCDGSHLSFSAAHVAARADLAAGRVRLELDRPAGAARRRLRNGVRREGRRTSRPWRSPAARPPCTWR